MDERTKQQWADQILPSDVIANEIAAVLGLPPRTTMIDIHLELGKPVAVTCRYYAIGREVERLPELLQQYQRAQREETPVDLGPSHAA